MEQPDGGEQTKTGSHWSEAQQRILPTCFRREIIVNSSMRKDVVKCSRVSFHHDQKTSIVCLNRVLAAVDWFMDSRISSNPIQGKSCPTSAAAQSGRRCCLTAPLKLCAVGMAPIRFANMRKRRSISLASRATVTVLHVAARMGPEFTVNVGLSLRDLSICE